MLEIQVVVTGKDQALSQVQHLKNIFENLGNVYQEVGEWWIKFLTGEVFTSEGAVYGRRWAQLNENYAFYKATKFGMVGILIASGAMQNGWNMYTGADYLQVKNEAQNDRGDYYAAFHQEGTTRMPKRELLVVDSGRATTIRDLIVNNINRQLNSL